MRTKTLPISSMMTARKEAHRMTKKRGRPASKRQPHTIFRIGHIQLVWMRKPKN